MTHLILEIQCGLQLRAGQFRQQSQSDLSAVRVRIRADPNLGHAQAASRAACAGSPTNVAVTAGQQGEPRKHDVNLEKEMIWRYYKSSLNYPIVNIIIKTIYIINTIIQYSI